MRLIVFIILGIIGGFYLNALAENYFIPDPCAYHTKVMNPMLSIFYSTPTWNAGHATSNLFTNILSLFIGIMFGILLNKLVKKILQSKID